MQAAAAGTDEGADIILRNKDKQMTGMQRNANSLHDFKTTKMDHTYVE